VPFLLFAWLFSPTNDVTYRCIYYSQAVDSAGSQTDPLDAPQRPDLRLLKPLWALYTKMLEKESSKINHTVSFCLSVCLSVCLLVRPYLSLVILAPFFLSLFINVNNRRYLFFFCQVLVQHQRSSRQYYVD
jgi:hypothetical protein